MNPVATPAAPARPAPLAAFASPAPVAAPVGVGWRHPHYENLLQALPALDFLEVHSENFFGQGGAALAVLREGRVHYPISLHGVGLSLGSAVGLDAWHLERLAWLVAEVDPVRVSDHASFARAPWRGQTIHAADLLPVPWTHEALAVMVANVQRVQERLRRPIAVENLSAYVGWAQADWSEPDFLTELARRSGCHLLVDVNNLMVNAKNARRAHLGLGGGRAAGPLAAGGGVGETKTAPEKPHQAGADTKAKMKAEVKVDVKAEVQAETKAELEAALETEWVAECCTWLDALGQVPVAELHVAGHVDAGDIVIDDHGSRVSASVWQVHAHALRRWPGVPTLVEWDTDVPELGVLLAEAQRARQGAGVVACAPQRVGVTA